jgi:phosphohistidine phosphatase
MTARRAVAMGREHTKFRPAGKKFIVTFHGHCAGAVPVYAVAMNIFLLRHGLAVERGTPGYENDALRPLTPKGRKQLRQVAAALRALKLRPDTVWASPLLRARGTAELVAAELKPVSLVTLAEELAPGGRAEILVEKIRAQNPPLENLLLVGHEPDFSELISLLVTGATGSGFALKKGGLAKLEVENLTAGRCARLAWLLTPKQMKLMD